MILGNIMSASSAVVGIISGVIALIIGAAVGIVVYRYVVSKKLGNAKAEAAKILEDSRQEAKSMRKEALIEAKEEQHRLRTEVDREVRERRAEVQKLEQRVAAREEALTRKEDTLDRRLTDVENAQAALNVREQDIVRKENEVAESHNKMLVELEKVSGMSREDAKNELLENMLDDAKRDAVQMAKEIEAEAKETAEAKARELVTMAVQRCATDHASEIAVSVVPLPNDEMKGRIIGRVGRNIRAFENATGVDVIIDDTPDVVTISAFDPVRREIGRVALEKLMSDGRIHPARIEETVEKVKNEIDNQMKDAGEEAAFEVAVYGLHPELVKILGRLKFRTSYGQNVLKHSIEVSHLAGILAAEIGADVKVAKRAGLLHDIGKAVDHEIEGTHVAIGVELAKKFKESEAVIHAIAAHHGDVEAKTVEAVIVQAADAISGARPGARRESLENYVKRLENIEKIANSFDGVEQSFAIQAGREIRVMVKPEKVDDSKTYFIAKEIAKTLENELEYPGQIKVSVIRELRSVEYAK